MCRRMLLQQYSRAAPQTGSAAAGDDTRHETLGKNRLRWGREREGGMVSRFGGDDQLADADAHVRSGGEGLKCTHSLPHSIRQSVST